MNIVKQLKESDQDFEWYPTTQAMLDCIIDDLKETEQVWENGNCTNKRVLNSHSILDCGAGDGKPLNQLSGGGDKYAIEKSKILIEQMPEDIYIVGTEFDESSLIDKQVEIIFSNPPYSEFAKWAVKIIREGNAKNIYLIIPQRWKDSKEIKAAIELRDASFEIIESFDFFNCERRSRAKVDIVKIELVGTSKYGRTGVKIDPFVLAFEKMFDFDTDKEKVHSWDAEKKSREKLKENLSGQIVKGENLIPALVELYNNELNELHQNFKAVSELDRGVLKALDVNVEGLQKALKQRIEGLKNKYWKEFFSNYDKITSRLTSGSRENILNKLNRHMTVDFTEGNAYAITIWVIKNANKYYDKQLINVVERLISDANCKQYKSNKRVYEKDEWRYWKKDRKVSHYGLELRIILENAWHQNTFRYDNSLDQRGNTLINDLTTIANNLGFVYTEKPSDQRLWETGKKQIFLTENKILMEVKVFKNGNIHIKFNQDFIRKLNVEFGRLKGWLKNPQEAAKELDISINTAETGFDINFQVNASHLPMIEYMEE